MSTNIVEIVPGLNPDQEKAAEAFFEFLFSDEKEMNISGGGGTGKSHLVSNLIDEVMPRYHRACELLGLKPRFSSVEVTSMTNTASEVLAVFIGRPVSTIHSFMRLKVVDDYDVGVSRIKKRDDWTVHEDVILFIDECSMIDDALDKLIQEGTHNCKIVYVGDHCQLFPIGGNNPIYRPGRMQSHELTIDMRTQVPAIRDLKAQLRRTVETGVFEPIRIVPGVIDHLDDDQMQLALAQTFAGQTMDSRILANTNRRVNDYNSYVRGLRGLPDEYMLGELLVNNTAIRLKRTMLSVEEEVEILNLGPDQDVPVTETVDLKIRMATLKTRKGVVLKDVPLPVDRGHFAALVDYFRKKGNWGKYYDLRGRYPDLRPRDAATVYKSQGSTYDTGFVDLGDISLCRNPDQAARMLYVALSRQRHRIFLFGPLAERFGGLIKV